MEAPKYDALRALGYSGTLNGMLFQYFLSQNGTGTTRNEREYNWLATKGFTTGTLNDRRAAYQVLNLAQFGSELITNGTFTVDTAGWAPNQSTLSVVTGEMVITATLADFSQAIFSLTGLTNLVNYKVEASITRGTSNQAMSIQVFDGVAQTNHIAFVTPNVMTAYTFNFQAKATSSELRMTSHTNVIGQTAMVDNVSVKRIN